MTFLTLNQRSRAWWRRFATRKPAAAPAHRRLRLEAMEPRLLLVVNGTPTSDWPAVGQVGGASGTLIEGEYVLTAAHCASSVFTVNGTSYSVAQIYRHPSYDYNSLGTDWANDIALLRLGTAVPGITPLPILRSTPQVGGSITLVGFGAGGTDSGSTGGAGVKRAGVASLDGLSATLVDLAFTVPGEANIAPGDSGGPGLVRVGSTYYVAGVHSCHTQTNSALGDYAYDTRVDAYASWIDSIVPAGASISVLGGGIAIADGDATPAANDGTDFGTVIQGHAGPTRTYTVRNDGTRTVSLGSVAAPAGFAVVEGLSPTLAAGASDTFTLQLSTATVGTASGDVVFNTGGNDYDFRITGTVLAGPGITVQPSAGLFTSESGLTATFSLRLDAAPTADVTIGLATSDASEGTVGAASVTFTPANWSTPQTVTVTGADDPIVDGSVAYKIVTLPATSGDPDYSGLNAVDVSLTNLDNEPAILVSPIGGLVTTESGGTATFAVWLNTQPTGNVTIGLATSDASEGTASAASLTFTPAGWSTPQTVTVTGADDPRVDGDVDYAIVTAPADSSDPAYSGLNAVDASLTNLDNDVAAITVASAAGLVTTEAGATDTFAVRLDSEPDAEVTIGVASADPTEGTPGPASLTFTPGNWGVFQTVTVTGADDAVIDGDVAYAIRVGPAVSADPVYSGLTGADVAVTNNDNDVARITVVPSSGLVTTESGGKATFAIRLGSQPVAEVTIGLRSSDPSEGTPSAASAIFTAGNWNVFQTVTVTGVDDAAADGNVAYAIITEPATGDASYSGMNPEDVWATNFDNDPGLVVEPAAGLVTTESGGTDTFTVRLSMAPAANVTVGLASGDATEGAVWPASLVFTPGNWAAAQTVTVGGLDDAAADGDVAFAISLTPASGDPIYGGLGPCQASVTNLDNEPAAGADAPGLYDPASSWWYLRNSSSAGTAESTLGYGPPGDGWVPLAGDWDGDGVTTVGLYDPKSGYFYLRNENTTGVGEIAFFYGEIDRGWLPVAGDWDGDGRDGIGLYDPATSVWYLRNSLTTGFADATLGYGPPRAGWLPLAGDWDGDRTQTVGLYDPSSGLFYLRNSNTSGMGDLAFLFGQIAAGWKPAVGDWNHDGRDSVGLYDPHDSVWYLTNAHSTGMADLAFGFGPGQSGWLPVAGDWEGARPRSQAAEGRAVDQLDLRWIVARELGGDVKETVDGLFRPAIGAREIDAVLAEHAT